MIHLVPCFRVVWCPGRCQQGQIRAHNGCQVRWIVLAEQMYLFFFTFHGARCYFLIDWHSVSWYIVWLAVDVNDLKGKVITQDGVIIFEKVPIVTPNNDLLLKELSFKVTTGMNCLISGPNGCVRWIRCFHFVKQGNDRYHAPPTNDLLQSGINRARVLSSVFLETCGHCSVSKNIIDKKRIS